jgi:GNAT superfamily N-acetyltransferase
MPAGISEVTIRELTAAEFPLIMPLIERHNANIAPEELRRRLDVMVPHGYHCIAAFLEDRIVGVAGYWLGARFYCGEYMDVDNVVVDPELRSRSIGAQMMDWLEAKARDLGCKLVVLDSYVTYAGAHRFYFRQGYEILGFHFFKRMQKESP